MPLMSGILLIKAFTKSDISNSLRIDKIIEKSIHLEDLIEKVQKLMRNRLDSYIIFSFM
jgi:hypothetical protein